MKTHSAQNFTRKKGSGTRPHGFALVTTLLLLGLLSVMALGLLSLSAVTLRSNEMAQPQAKAEANARLALMMAIGQLQEELGPDQRINAPADLLTPGLSDGRQRWVGTWESWPADDKQRPAPQFRRWLISGNQDMLDDPDYPANATDLVSLMRSGDRTSVLVSAPRVALENGAYAYAVCDENAKARIGPSLNAGEEDLTAHFSRLHSPPAGHNVLPGLEALTRNDTRLDHLFSERSVDLISAAENPPTSRAGSFSVWSEGLLTDVRNGGLRKDLSLHFHNPASGDVTQALYEHNGRRGINFRELRTFHEVSSRLTYDASGFSHPDGGTLNPDVPVMAGSGNQVSAATDPFFPYLRPMIVRASWQISAYARETPAGSGQYMIHIAIEPIIWLWNPFDVNLVMRPGGHLTVKCWGIPYDVTIRIAGVEHTDHINDYAFDWFNMQIGQTTPVVMRPGEVLVYSRGRSVTGPVRRSNSRTFEAGLGWADKGGFWYGNGPMANAGDPISISMTPSTRRGASTAALAEFLSYVGINGPTESQRYASGIIAIDSSGWLGALGTADFPASMFQPVPEKSFSAATDLATPQPLALFSFFTRTEREGLSDSRYMARLNPAAMGFDHQAADTNTLQALPCETRMHAYAGSLDRVMDINDEKGFFGASYMADAGQSYLVTHSIPRERPISLGAFQHALANGLESWRYNAGGDFHDRILQPSISHPIGNSFAPPCIDPDQTTGAFNAMAAVDHSWLANDALWDQWFVSSLAERDAPHHSDMEKGTARDLLERLTGLQGEPRLLPNRHYRYAGLDPQADVDALFSGTTPILDAYQKIASLLRIHGAFNINSTDTTAWLAMFRSCQDLKVPVEAAPDNGSTWQEARNPIAGLLIPKGSAAQTADLADPSNEQLWTGFRDATDEELEELAEAMVEEVRKRGPFLSLADFVNRRLSTDPTLASRGALQAALDRSLNKSLETGARSNGGNPSSAFPEAEQGSMMTHVPGHVKQGDILTSLGTRFTPRSDTFTIRAYGEALGPSGEVLASARCEAVVQRNADYVDPSDASDILPANLTSEANQRFGRKFSVVSFRWISKNEP